MGICKVVNIRQLTTNVSGSLSAGKWDTLHIDSVSSVKGMFMLCSVTEQSILYVCWPFN